VRYISVKQLAKLGIAVPGIAVLVACGPQDHPPAAHEQSTTLDVGGRARQPSLPTTTTPSAAAEGSLLIATRTSAPSYLGQVHVVARDADGKVVAGADEEQAVAATTTAPSDLSLALPAAADYRIELEARTIDPKPSECHGVVAPVSIAAGASARLQVLSWQCGERTGYVPPSADSACYWLVDWLSVGEAAPRGGEPVQLALQLSAELSAAPNVHWSAEPASAGTFTDDAASATSFSCAAEGPVTLSATVTQGDCVEQLTQPLACAR
jgi:hypothetical protein